MRASLIGQITKTNAIRDLLDDIGNPFKVSYDLNTKVIHFYTTKKSVIRTLNKQEEVKIMTDDDKGSF